MMQIEFHHELRGQQYQLAELQAVPFGECVQNVYRSGIGVNIDSMLK